MNSEMRRQELVNTLCAIYIRVNDFVAKSILNLDLILRIVKDFRSLYYQTC